MLTRGVKNAIIDEQGKKGGLFMDGIKTFEYELIGSTNDEAKAYAVRTDKRESALFIAKEQSAGRGRQERSFISRRGRGIYLSVLYFTDAPLDSAVSITSAAALIVARAIERVTGERMRIKWVNDVYNDRGKVAGILTEALTLGEESAMIVGVGINIGEEDFPDEISQIASSIGEVSDGQVKEITDLIAKGILAHARDPLDRSFMDEYRKRSMLDGKHVELFSAGESIGLGTVRGISDDGGLILLFDGENESRIIRTGEVSVREK